MKKFVLYNPRLGAYISKLSYSRRDKGYQIEYTQSKFGVRFWNSASSAESQAQRVFDWSREVPLEVHQIQ